KRAYCLKTQPATGETYPKSDLFNKASRLCTFSAYSFFLFFYFFSFFRPRGGGRVGHVEGQDH
ncbi:hypothetical protein AB7Z21_24775, partial [Klebsiella pneumoniae]|uniref:hypothetical protein n=1 Tax=Klebsiella pneumoniae TaxID=573 RepID=UPI0034E3F76E